MQNLVSQLQGPSEREKQGAEGPAARRGHRACANATCPPPRCPIRTRAHPPPRPRARVPAEVMAKLEDMQVKDTLRMINNMVELCFSECVTGFRSKAVRPPPHTPPAPQLLSVPFIKSPS